MGLIKIRATGLVQAIALKKLTCDFTQDPAVCRPRYYPIKLRHPRLTILPGQSAIACTHPIVSHIV